MARNLELRIPLSTSFVETADALSNEPNKARGETLEIPRRVKRLRRHFVRGHRSCGVAVAMGRLLRVRVRIRVLCSRKKIDEAAIQVPVARQMFLTLLPTRTKKWVSSIRLSLQNTFKLQVLSHQHTIAFFSLQSLHTHLSMSFH